MNENKKSFMEVYQNLEPGKYWKLPKNKEHMREEMLNDKSYYAGAKNDGEWGRLIIGEDEVLIQSRNISVKTHTYGDKTESLPHLVEEAKRLYEPGTVLLGEICFSDPSKTSKDVGTILRCKSDKAISRQEAGEPLQFKVFDILSKNYEALYDNPAEARRAVVESLPTGEFISITEYSDDAETLLTSVFARGGEGIVLMNRSEPYKFGNAKAWHSIKIKRNLPDFEAPIVRLSPTKKAYEGNSINDWKFWELTLKNGTVKKVIRDMHALLSQGMLLEEAITVEEFFDGVSTGVEVKMPIIKAEPITKFYFYGWPAGVVINKDGKEITITSGITDDDARELAENGFSHLIAVYSGMELTEDGSIRHPYLVRLRDEA